MAKFVELMNTKSDRERYRPMLFVKLSVERKWKHQCTKIMHIISTNHNIPNIILCCVPSFYLSFCLIYCVILYYIIYIASFYLIYCVISYHSVNIFNWSFAVYYAYMYLSSILTNYDDFTWCTAKYVYFRVVTWIISLNTLYFIIIINLIC